MTVFASNATLGDVNFDGEITASDARAVLRVSASLDKFNEEQTKLADVDYNNTITAADARKILRVSASLDKFDDKDSTADSDIPQQLRAVIDGTYKITAADTTMYYYDHAVYISAGEKGAIYSYIDNDFDYSYLLTDDEQIYELNPSNNTAMKYPDYENSEYYPAETDTLKALKAISDEKPDFTITTENLNNIQYETYTFCTDNAVMIYDGSIDDFMCLYTTETNFFGKEENVCYIINGSEGIYTKIDRLFASSMGISYDDMMSLALDETALADETADKITVKETKAGDTEHKCITFVYSDAGFENRFYFENGELVRLEEYDANGQLTGTMIIYDFSADIDEDIMNLDNYEKVNSIEFFSNYIYW